MFQSHSPATTSGKFVIFEYLPIFFGVVYGCNRLLSIFSSGTYRKRLRLSPLMKPIVSDIGKNYSDLTEIFVVVDSKLILENTGSIHEMWVFISKQVHRPPQCFTLKPSTIFHLLLVENKDSLICLLILRRHIITSVC